MTNSIMYQLFSNDIDPIRTLLPSKYTRSQIRIALTKKYSPARTARTINHTPFSQYKRTSRIMLDQRSSSVTKYAYSSPQKTTLNTLISNCSQFNDSSTEIKRKLSTSISRLRGICDESSQCADALNYQMYSYN